MDHELKQRLIGAVVITALAAIFVPMLFDDPVDNSGKAVTELAAPEVPADSSAATNNLPADKTQVLARPDSELSVSEEDSHADATANDQGTNNTSSEQTGQSGDSSDVGSDIHEGEPVDDLALKQSNQNEKPSLDTGEVDEAGQPKISAETPSKNPDATQKSGQEAILPTEKPASKQGIPEEPKHNPVPLTKKPKVTKTKHVDAQKTNSKLIRWSVQAGSFAKKENAQTLVDKLRKQGLPASIVTKGNLFRIKIGPALDKKKAIDMKAKLDKQNIQSYLQSE
jgi:DedD protein